MSEKKQNPGIKVADEVNVMQGLLDWVQKSFALRSATGKVALGVGYFAAVLSLGDNRGLAMSTDGVGSKVLLAQLMDKYDTVGIDCIGMNVNDLICVGAEPISMLNYLAVQKADGTLLAQIAEGLYRGAELAHITLPGGEMAKLPEIINGVREGRGFDLAGTAVGLVPLDEVITGQDVREGDVVIGLASSGIHSNGFTLARRVLFQDKGLKINTYIEELGCTLGEELLKPTRIYVLPVMEILRAVDGVKAMAHMTGGGLFNLTRTDKAVGYEVDFWPEVPPLFDLIQKAGALSAATMFSQYNMGVGFCLTVDPASAQRVLDIAERHRVPAWRLGCATLDEERNIALRPFGLVSRDKELVSSIV